MSAIEEALPETLTQPERDAWTTWLANRNQPMDHYFIDNPQDRAQTTTRETFLRERVVPPPLAAIQPSRRPRTEIRSNRLFPQSQPVELFYF